MLHFICSPFRAASIISEVREIEGWLPTTIYEPIPVCNIHRIIARILTRLETQGQVCPRRATRLDACVTVDSGLEVRPMN